jgi:hypothetical protein
MQPQHRCAIRNRGHGQVHRRGGNALRKSLISLAGPTRLELATSCVTGRRSNRLNYGPAVVILNWWAVQDLNLRPSGCKPDALTAELTAQCF